MNEILKDVVVVLVTIGLTYFISIKVKFATSEKKAMSHAKSFILSAALLGFHLYVAWLLFKEFTSPDSLDKKSLFSILLYSFALFNSLLSWFFSRILKIIGRLINILEMQPCREVKNERE